MSFALAAGLENHHETVERELRRVVSRIQTLGSSGVSPHLVELRTLVESIAEIAWHAEHGMAGRPSLPELPAHALADQFTVLTHDAQKFVPGGDSTANLLLARLEEARRLLS